MVKFHSEEEWKKAKQRRFNRTVYTTIFLVALVIAVPIVINAYGDIVVLYQYRRVIGAHLENALDGSTPDLMKQELIAAKQGMISEGLQTSDYGKFWAWQQTDDYKMDFTYRYIDGLINRTDYVIQWRNTYINATTSQTLQDVYDEMLANLRTEYNRRGPIDWTAYPTWILKHHGWWYFVGDILFVFVIAIALLILLVIYKGWKKYDKFGYSFSSYDIDRTDYPD